ncbi:MAG TPA: extracellular solute-binding protein [Myxococcaceae bacterium]|nr:extracellular solute-binding protein [Myxococcaceae bacterium]
MRTLFVLLAAVVGILMPGAATAQAKLVVWHSYRGGEKAAFEKVVAAFNARPDTKIKIDPLAVPFDAFADKISAAVPRGKGPDIFIYAQDRMGGWVEAGNTVEPIDFYVDDALKGRFIPTTVEALTYRGNLYGLPLDYKVIALIHNKKLLKTPPKTTGELVKVAQGLTNRAAGKFGLAWSYGDFYYVASLLNGFGGGVFDKATRPTMNAPENVKALELLVKWEKGGFMPAEPSSALITSLFNEGKAAMVFSGPWFLGEVASDIDYGVAPLPTIDEVGGKPMRPWMTVEGVFVSAQSQHKDTAFEFAKYATGAEAGKVMALEGRQSPAAKAVYDDSKVQADPVLSAFRKQVEVAVPMPNVAEMTMMWSPATTALNKVNAGNSPKEAMDVAQKALQKDVDALRKKK